MGKNRIIGSRGAAMVSAIALAVGTGTALGQVAFRTQGDERRVQMSSQQVTQTMRVLAARGDASRVVIQFNAPITGEQRVALGSAGVTLLSSLGNNAYFANLDAFAVGDLDICDIDGDGDCDADDFFAYLDLFALGC